MSVHDLNFGRESTYFFKSVKFLSNWDGQKLTSTTSSIKKYHVLNSAPRQQIMWVSSVLCYIFVIFLKSCAFVKKKEHGIPSLDGAPHPSHTGPVLPHNCLNLDLNPKTIWCYYYKNGMGCQSKENWTNFDVKWAITCVFLELFAQVKW